MYINPIKVTKNTKPVCFVNDWIVLFKSPHVIILDVHTEEVIKKIKTPIPFIKSIISFIKPIHRLLRLGAKNGVYAMGKIFIIINKKLYSISTDEFYLKMEYQYEKGSGPLHLINIEGIENFKDGLYFGDYFGNNSKEPINITRRNYDGSFEVIYTFEKGKTNHIHNLIPDKYNNCVWILAGDFNDAASIWKAKNNFDTVERVVFGSQQYRSCLAFPTKDGLLYMTDNQFEQNYIRLLTNIENSYVSEPIKKINGSVIYGCIVGDKIVFSTSTEPSVTYKNKILNLLVRKPGLGIIKNESHIISGSLKDGFHIIDKNKKDFLPYRLFQFGTIMFPAGKNPTNKLFSYSVGNIKNDLHTEIRKL